MYDVCSADGSTQTESNNKLESMYPDIDIPPTSFSTPTAKVRPDQAAIVTRRQRRGEPHTEHGLGTFSHEDVPDGALRPTDDRKCFVVPVADEPRMAVDVKRSTGHTHTHTTAEHDDSRTNHSHEHRASNGKTTLNSRSRHRRPHQDRRCPFRRRATRTNSA